MDEDKDGDGDRDGEKDVKGQFPVEFCTLLAPRLFTLPVPRGPFVFMQMHRHSNHPIYPLRLFRLSMLKHSAASLTVSPIYIEPGVSRSERVELSFCLFLTSKKPTTKTKMLSKEETQEKDRCLSCVLTQSPPPSIYPFLSSSPLLPSPMLRAHKHLFYPWRQRCVDGTCMCANIGIYWDSMLLQWKRDRASGPRSNPKFHI